MHRLKAVIRIHFSDFVRRSIWRVIIITPKPPAYLTIVWSYQRASSGLDGTTDSAALSQPSVFPFLPPGEYKIDDEVEPPTTARPHSSIAPKRDPK